MTTAKPFGIKEVKLTPLPSGTAVTLEAERVLTFKEQVVSANLLGRGKIVSVATVAQGADFSLEEGGIPLEAYALMTGRTVTTSGTTPNVITTLVGDSEVYFPYFKIEGRAVGEDATDDIRVTLWHCKLTSGMEGSIQDGQFFVTKCQGIATDDGTNGVWKWDHRETGVAL